MNRLDDAVRMVASAPILLVACDLDGTLAPIVPHPREAKMDRLAEAALLRLSRMQHTGTALVSGRARSDLRERWPHGGDLHLIGSHGGEGLAAHPPLSPALSETLSALRAQIARACDGVAGAWAEAKPLGVAVHYRQAEAVAAAELCRVLRTIAAPFDGVKVIDGKKVLEFVVGGGNKGLALQALRHRAGATSVVFIGDDVTDEDAFGVLQPGDLGVKVGDGNSRAAHRVQGIDEVAKLLESLVARRGEWLASRRLTPIDRHWVLSDQRTSAIIDANGRLVWLCLPRLDSPAIFAEMLGGPGRGYWDIVAADCPNPPRQEWLGDSMVLRTYWNCAGGSEGNTGGGGAGGASVPSASGAASTGMIVTDYLDASVGRAFQRAGRSDLLRVISGKGRATVRFAPRADFGRRSTQLVIRDGGVEVVGAIDPMVLVSPGVAWRLTNEGAHQTAVADIDLDGRQDVVLELRWGTASVRAAPLPELERRRQSERFWSSWAGSLNVPSYAKQHVLRSALAIRSLCHGPTGSIAAAATTSLPEQLGGVRNWDYRFCWPRDSAMSAAALVRLGNTGVALRLLDWLAEIVAGLPSPDRLRPIYDLAGADLGIEAELSELAGYGLSRPVRVGNAAATQVQLDVFGPIVDLASLVAQQGAPITPEVWRLVESMVEAVASRWKEPDHGIWEIRAAPRHHVYSKLMCWLAVDRALMVADLALGQSKPTWSALRDEIASDLKSHGWNERVGAYTGFYGGDTLDASVLLMATSGFTSGQDERLHKTVDAIQRSLRRGSTVLRYTEDDGLPGTEGGMHICTFWLIEALVVIGRLDEARTLFEVVCDLIPPSGLLSEQCDPKTNAALGNYPQAYSHLALINAAVRLNRGA